MYKSPTLLMGDKCIWWKNHNIQNSKHRAYVVSALKSQFLGDVCYMFAKNVLVELEEDSPQISGVPSN